MFALTLTLALLASSASARSLRMPEHRFASLEGMALDGDAVAREPRHAADFAVFDRPLAADPDPHHRVARDAPEACDCADNPDLVGEIVESAPVMEDHETASWLDVPLPQRPSKAVEFVEAPEELHGSAVSTDDVHFDEDQEATLSQGGLEPLNEAGDVAAAERPARETTIEEEEEASKEQTIPEAEVIAQASVAGKATKIEDGPAEEDDFLENKRAAAGVQVASALGEQSATKVEVAQAVESESEFEAQDAAATVPPPSPEAEDQVAPAAEEGVTTAAEEPSA